jgi:hypothetical protein
MDPIQLPDSHTNAAKHLYHRAGLSPSTRSTEILNLKYLDPTTAVKT